jgi:hypothetical protein
MIPAVISGRTMTWVSASSQTAPTRKIAIPTRSHDIRPTSRSHCGTLKIPVSSRGSISMYCGSPSSGGSPRRRSRPRSIAEA